MTTGTAAVREARDAAPLVETIDRVFHRPVATLVVRLLRASPVSPNQVTLLSGIFGLAAGAAMIAASLADRWLMVVAGLLAYTSVILDCADGQLARARGSSSVYGHALDGIVDGVVVAALQIGLAVFLIRASYDPVLVVALVWFSTYCWRLHAERFDLVKHGYGIEDEKVVTDRAQPKPERIAAEVSEGAGLSLVHRFVIALYRTYSRVQRNRRNLISVLRLPSARLAPGDMPGRRRAYQRLRRTLALTGTGSHLFVTYSAVAAAAFWTAAPLLAWAIISIPMNALALLAEYDQYRLTGIPRNDTQQTGTLCNGEERSPE